MADRPLFVLDAEARWQLAYDSNQWIIQRRTKKPRVGRLEGGSIADSGYRGVSFIGSTKRTLYRCIREAGVVLTLEAQVRLDALPERFLDFITDPESFAEQLEAKAA